MHNNIELIELTKFIKKLFSNKNYIKLFLISFLSFIIILGIVLGLIWFNRVSIFDYFAKEYLQELQDTNINNSNTATDEIQTEQSVFSEERLIIETVKKTNPAVISIIISKNVPKYETYIDPNQQQNPFGGLFPDFFFNTPQYKQNGTEKKEVGGGSGFFVSNDGLIVTNKHVVDQTDAEYTIFTNDGEKHSAEVIALDPILDIAILKVDGSNFSYLSLGNSDNLQVGQSVIAIGNALAEFRNTVSVGVVSGLARSIVAGDFSGNNELLDHVIQTDAAINPGNSGGPLLDLFGRVVGVNVAIVQGSQNIGFALPINSVKSAIESVKTTGKILRPYIGIRYITITSELKETNNLVVDYGVLVKTGQNQNELAVIPGSPADKAGIVENDIILEINGIKLNKDNSLASIVRQKNIGETITLKVLHKGEEKNMLVTLEAAKDN